MCIRDRWYSSTLSLYEALEKEKTEQKKVQKDNPKTVSYTHLKAKLKYNTQVFLVNNKDKEQ